MMAWCSSKGKQSISLLSPAQWAARQHGVMLSQLSLHALRKQA